MTSFDRPNLYIEIKHKGANIQSDLKSLVEDSSEGSIIVYCPTKSSVQDVATTIRGMGLRCLIYHGDLGDALRKKNHEEFVRDKVRLNYYLWIIIIY